PEDEPSAGEYGHDLLAGPDAESREKDAAERGFEEPEENPDDVDTTSIPVLTDAGLPDSGAADGGDLASDAAPDTGISEDVFVEAPADAGYSDDVFAEAPPDAAYSEEVFAEAPPDEGYSEEVFAEAPLDEGYPEDLFVEDAGSRTGFAETPEMPEAAEAPDVPGTAAS